MTHTVLVTGGAGFIGSHLVDKLVEDGHDVKIFDNLDPQVHQYGKPSYLNPRAEFIRGDIRNDDDIRAAIEDIEVIFHDAAAVGVGQSMYEIQHYVDVNTHGTSKLLDILANEEHSVKKIIVASSMSIYGEGAYECNNCGVVYPRLRSEEQLKAGEWEVKCTGCNKEAKPIATLENKPLHPTSIYAITKRDHEEMCLIVGKAYGIPTVALRYFNVYGPRQSLSNPYTGVCAIFSSRIKNGNPPLIFEDGLQTRDFVSVYDIVRANILVMENSSANYEVFNVGTSNPKSILEIANLLISLYKSNLKPKIVQEYRRGDIRHCYADISKIKSKLGYSPMITFEKGMKELVAWGFKVEAKDYMENAHMELINRGLIR
ncbi:MAG: nucleoside-diphosphate sugar epimerase [Candidatus Altiarchaeales archaeon WOR_SM1_79]|nr:MAG: nucleoside-diphosphate sugar epimerase [Candidatus Altiarchaeales archaeon WOR_SM1_79]